LSHEQRSELRTAVIFLLLIFLPSGLLGYLSWRAIKNERLLARQKIIEGYRQFARLVVRGINNELEDMQARLEISVEDALQRFVSPPAIDQLDSLVKAEPFISSCVLLSRPGQVTYPPEPILKHGKPFRWQNQSEAVAQEYELYRELLNRGEELEYGHSDFDSAIVVYRQILAKTTSPQIYAMANSLIGRAQTKKTDWASALATYQNLLGNFPEVRDLNKMYLRFLAQYQIAVCLNNLNRDEDAVKALLQMHEDLVERSDTINQLQYAHFLEWIEDFGPLLLSSPNLANAEEYQNRFQGLAEQKKRPISDQYFVQLFDEELHELVIKRKPHRPIVRYFSGQADHEPFLLGYATIPDGSGSHVAGLLGFRVNLTELRDQILPTFLHHLKIGDEVILAILDDSDNFVIGTSEPRSRAAVTHALDSPFKFWQVGVFLASEESAPARDFGAELWLWLISFLLLSIFFGTYLFIRHARREARLSEMKSTFVSRVSHELRTPLTSIKMLAEHLEMQLQESAATPEQDLRKRADQYLNVIRRESDRLGRLIENILDFAKIERGVKDYVFEYELPKTILQKAIDSFRPFAEAKGFVIDARIDDSLPEILIDSDALTQAILNLLSNAVKYSEGERVIFLRAFRDRDHVGIEIEDRGIGIPSAKVSRIFDEFYRIDQKLNSNQQSGMGLGLTLVKHIVLAHGGTIKVHSQEGKGSTFAIALPIPPEALAGSEKSKEVRKAGNFPVASAS
jgi:signal transduction histidine kinase